MVKFVYNTNWSGLPWTAWAAGWLACWMSCRKPSGIKNTSCSLECHSWDGHPDQIENWKLKPWNRRLYKSRVKFKKNTTKECPSLQKFCGDHMILAFVREMVSLILLPYFYPILSHYDTSIIHCFSYHQPLPLENWAAQPASEESWCAYWWWPSCRWSHRFGGKIVTFDPRRALVFLYMFVSFNESIETLYKFAALESPEYDNVSKIDSYWDSNATHAKLMGTWFNCTTKVGWNESLPDVSSIVCHFRIPSLKQYTSIDNSPTLKP